MHRYSIKKVKKNVEYIVNFYIRIEKNFCATIPNYGISKRWSVKAWSYKFWVLFFCHASDVISEGFDLEHLDLKSTSDHITCCSADWLLNGSSVTLNFKGQRNQSQNVCKPMIIRNALSTNFMIAKCKQSC